MLSRRLTILGCLSILAVLCIAPTVEALTIIAFHSTETGAYLFTPTSPTTNHAVATGTGTGTLGSFQSSGFQDSDFTDPLHQTVTNGHFTQDYGSGNTLFGTFRGTATATSAPGGTFTLSVPFIGGTGALSDVIGGSGTATGMFQFVSTNPDQTQNFTYALSLTGERGGCAGAVHLCTRWAGRSALATVLPRVADPNSGLSFVYLSNSRGPDP